jgi:uncharacterized protein (TIGR02594 family)
MNRVLEVAFGEYGVKGIPGASHSSQILRYFSNLGFKSIKDDETAWCAAFVNWCFWKRELKGTGSLMARSFLTFGRRTLAPKLGDLAVFWRGSKDSIYGHVGFFIKEDKDVVYVLGGNQSNAVNITAFPKSQVLEYRTYSDKK